MLSRRGPNRMDYTAAGLRRRFAWAASVCLVSAMVGCDPGRSTAPPQAELEAPTLETIAGVEEEGGRHQIDVALNAADVAEPATVDGTPSAALEGLSVDGKAQAEASADGQRREVRLSTTPANLSAAIPLVPPVAPASERQIGLEASAGIGLPSSEERSAAGDSESGPPIPKTPALHVSATAGDKPAVNDPRRSDPPPDYRQWPVPDLTLFVSGQQHGYIEPCGCTGLENQKGGVARRMTLAKQLRERGWPLLPVDAGNLVRRFGKQADIKYHRSLEALRAMGYAAVGFGPDDVRLGVGELILEAADDGDPKRSIYASANVVLLDESLMPKHKMLVRNGMRVGITSVLDPESLDGPISDEIILQPIEASARKALEAMNAEDPTFTVLTFYGDEDTAKQLVRDVPGFDLVVVAGGYGEPTFRPVEIDDTKTRMILTGDKGMYVGLVGLYADAPLRYARVSLTHEFKDAAEMRTLMAEYQEQLKQLGLQGLGLEPIPHPSGKKFVGTARCGECHTTAFDIWQGSMHAEATEHLVHPGERSDVPRHFDPECLSCHVTGWNPQNFYPYESGYVALAKSDHLHGNGCENCHGPGAAHVAAEEAPGTVSEAKRDELRLAMRLPLDQARETCMKCHDLDNSPDFHEEGAFDDYWAEIEHYGLD